MIIQRSQAAAARVKTATTLKRQRPGGASTRVLLRLSRCNLRQLSCSARPLITETSIRGPSIKHGQTLFMEITKGLPIDQRLYLGRSNGPQIRKEPSGTSRTSASPTATLLGRPICYSNTTISNCTTSSAPGMLFSTEISTQTIPLVTIHTLLAPSTRQQIWRTGPGFTGR